MHKNLLMIVMFYISQGLLHAYPYCSFKEDGNNIYYLNGFALGEKRDLLVTSGNDVIPKELDLYKGKKVWVGVGGGKFQESIIRNVERKGSGTYVGLSLGLEPDPSSFYITISDKPFPSQSWSVEKVDKEDETIIMNTLGMKSTGDLQIEKIVTRDRKVYFLIQHPYTDERGCHGIVVEKGNEKIIQEFNGCEAYPMLDFDDDGIPEIIHKFSDSADAQITSLIEEGKYLIQCHSGQ